jgi:hypothetical protein
MAARQNDPDRGNLQVIVVNLNGNNHTLQDALRTVHDMIRRDTPPSARQAHLNGKGKAKALPGAKNGNGEKEPQEEESLFVEPVLDEIEEPETNDADLPPTSPKRKPRIPKVIPDLDFNSASPTFREFAAERKPNDQFDWYLLVASWMKDHKQVEEVGINHAYTASRYIGADWSLPEDVGQPFRDGRRQGLFVRGSKNGLSKITHVGEDRIKRMGKKA